MSRLNHIAFMDFVNRLLSNPVYYNIKLITLIIKLEKQDDLLEHLQLELMGMKKETVKLLDRIERLIGKPDH